MAVLGHKIMIVAALLLGVAGCSEDIKSCDDPSYPGIGECVYTVKIEKFQVIGNDQPANGREQIVASNNNGSFSVHMNLSPVDSDDITLSISDSENLSSTVLEKKFFHLTCGYYPFCQFKDVMLNCSYSSENKIACESGWVGSGPVQADYPLADITQLLNGNQTDLFIILVAAANGAVSSQRSIPVTFRY